MLTPAANLSAVTPIPGQAGERVASVDTLRGLVITLMIFVNDVAGVTAAPSWLKHVNATADAMTLPDVVFPAFLFIAGMSIPLAFGRARAQGHTRRDLLQKILARTLALLVMGILMVNAEEHNPWFRGAWGLLAYLAMLLAFVVVPAAPVRARNTWRIARTLGWIGVVILALTYRTATDAAGATPHALIFGPLFDPTDYVWLRHSWWGILGLIGWAYLTASLLYLLLERRREWLIGATGLLMLLYVAARADFATRLSSREWLAWATPILAPIQTLVGWINSHVSIGESLGSLAAVTMAGCCLGSILTGRSDVNTHRDRIRWTTLFVCGLFVAALLFDPLYGLNKIRATPSWCFLSAAITAATWLGLYWLMDIRGRRSWSRLVSPAGANPLLAYLLHPLLYFIAAFVGVPLAFYHNATWPLPVNIGGSFLMAVFIVQLTGLVARTGYRLKV